MGVFMSYTTIKLPTEFVLNVIDPLVESEGLGFTSRTEVIKTALREYSDKQSQQNKQNKPVVEVIE
jgi:metal-responsive CopG/Arc/MetJ family transcriptional regulator